MTGDTSIETFAAFAIELADLARGETAGWAEQSVEDKSGDGAFDPVTAADRAAERAIRERIAACFPEHGVQGEEYGDRPQIGALSWSIDPIDGTRAYMCGLPTWTTLIALLEQGCPILGLIDAPRLDERYVGTGEGAVLIAAGVQAPLRASACSRIADARLSTTDPFLFSDAEAEAFRVIREAARTTRYGLDAYAYARLAAGSIDLVVEAGLKPHDYNALIPVVRGAGGRIGDWRGGEDYEGGRVVAAATPDLFEKAVALLDR